MGDLIPTILKKFLAIFVVQGTNDSSIVSKWSITNVGYFDDDYLQHFIAKRSRRCPLINRGYYIRAKAVESVFVAFLASEHPENGKKQIISLGAGFDSSYFRLKKQGKLENAVYIEVDFPAVVQRKLALIKQSSELCGILEAETQQTASVVPDSIETCIALQTSDYILLGVDLTRLDTLTACLSHLECDKTRPTLFLSEVVLTYMPQTLADSVIGWASEFTHAVFAAYEQLYPDDPFGQVMMKHFQKLNSPLRCIDTYPTMADQVRRYIKQGWQSSQAVDLNNFYSHYIGAEEKRRIESLEPFDEHETWHLKCSHYTLLCAFNGRCENVAKIIFPDISEQIRSFSSKRRQDHTVERDIKGDAASTGPAVKQCLTSSLSPLSFSEVATINAETVCFGRYDLGHYCFTIRTAHGEVSDVFRSLQIGTLGREKESTACLQLVSFECDQALESKGEVASCPESTFSRKRLGHSMCWIKPKSVLVIGGFGEEDNKHMRLGGISFLTFNDDQTTNESTGNDPPVSPRPENMSGVKLDLMYHSTCQLSDGRVLVFGGRRSPLKPNKEKYFLIVLQPRENAGRHNDVTGDSNTSHSSQLESPNHIVANKHEYDIRANTDTLEEKCQVGKVTSQETNVKRVYGQGHLNCDTVPVEEPALHRWRHSACCLLIDDTEHVVVYGGRTVSMPALDDCWLLNTSTYQWRQVPLSSNLIGSLHSHSACVWQNKCVISGGLDFAQLPSNRIHVLTLCKVEPQRLQGNIHGLRVQSHMHPRYSHTSHVRGDLLYLLGGVSFHQPPPGLTSVDLCTGSVCEYSLQVPSSLNQPIMLCNHDSVYQEGDIFILGGGGNCFSFGTHFNSGPYRLSLPPLSQK